MQRQHSLRFYGSAALFPPKNSFLRSQSTHQLLCIYKYCRILCWFIQFVILRMHLGGMIRIEGPVLTNPSSLLEGKDLGMNFKSLPLMFCYLWSYWSWFQIVPIGSYLKLFSHIPSLNQPNWGLLGKCNCSYCQATEFGSVYIEGIVRKCIFWCDM